MRVNSSEQSRSYEEAMLRKVKDVQKAEGEAALKLIREAEEAKEVRRPASPPGTGRLVDTTA